MSDKTENGKSKKARAARRSERVFVPQSAYPTWLIGSLGMVGASVLGAGCYAYFYGESFRVVATEETAASGPTFALYMIAAGSVLMGIAIWLGTSSEALIRVGSPGIGVERGDVRRMPWANVSKITWESEAFTLVVDGQDDAGTAWTLRVQRRAHPDAFAWIVKESLDRIPKVVEIDDAVLETFPAASTRAGEKIELEPLQVVGRRDAVGGKIISYEPDARVCTRCERVYLATSVPKKCKCGASMMESVAKVEAAAPASSGAASEA